MPFTVPYGSTSMKIMSSSATTTETVWGGWCSGEVSASSSATSFVWSAWSSLSSTSHVDRSRFVETDEQKAARLQRERSEQEEVARRAAEKVRADKEAEEKAEALLRGNLEEGQRAEYEADRHFHVIAASGRRYRIRKGWAGNVEEIDPAGKSVARYCIHPIIGCPHPDNMLAQKLMLETDEKKFLKIANRTRLTA